MQKPAAEAAGPTQEGLWEHRRAVNPLTALRRSVKRAFCCSSARSKAPCEQQVCSGQGEACMYRRIGICVLGWICVDGEEMLCVLFDVC